MPEHMQAREQSFTDLMQLCGEHLGKRQRIEDSPQSRKNSGPCRSNRQSSSSASSTQDGDLLQMIAGLSLRQEDLLNQMFLDRSFVVFFQCGKGSVMPQLLQTSKDWRNKRQTEGGNQPLRTLMFTTLIEDFIRRAQSLKLEDPEDALVLGFKF